MIFDGPDHEEMRPSNRAKMLRAARVFAKNARRPTNHGREYYRDLAARMAELGAPKPDLVHRPDPERVKRRLARWQRRLNGALKQVESRARGCTEREIARRMGQCAGNYANRG